MTTMDCDEIRTMLAGYADRELAPLEREAVASHLAHCGRCRTLVTDQKRVQRVLESYTPPPVPPERWSVMSRRLAAELAGREYADLVTQPRLDSLDDLEDEPAADAAATRAAPRPRPTRPAAHRAPVVAVLGPRARPRRPRFSWVAHTVGAIAAAVLIAVGIATVLRTADFGLAPDALATQADVEIHEVEVMDPNYNVIVYAGGKRDAAFIWVEPLETEN
jgi:anti-sigma factor RsiW